MGKRSDAGGSQWPLILSHAAHEVRTPLTVAGGYLRMVLNGTTGPITDKQRQFLQEVEKATSRIRTLADEMSYLAKMEISEITFERRSIDLAALVHEAIAALPPSERELDLELENQAAGATVQGDPIKLRTALTSVLFAVRRELVTSSKLFVRVRRTIQDRVHLLWIAIAGDHRIEIVDSLTAADLGPFNEKRGGCGLTPSIARRVVAEHRGRIWSPVEAVDDDDESGPVTEKTGAVLVLPEA
jgi:signal transduction histidine kinase